MKPENYYLIERVPSKYADPRAAREGVELWYCHMNGFPYIPVGGSIGIKEEAAAVCKIMNLNGRVYYR